MDPIDAHAAHLTYLNRRPRSIKQRLWLLHHLEQWSGWPLLELTHEDLAAYVAREGTGPEVRAAAVSHVRGFYRWALEEELIQKDPSVRLKRPRVPKSLPRPMPAQLAGHAIKKAPEPIKSWLMLAAYAGLRACEIAQLRGSDFQVNGNPPILLIRESKGGDPSVVPIGEPLMVTAVYLSQIDGWCFPLGAPSSRWDPTPLRCNTCGKTFEEQSSRGRRRLYCYSCQPRIEFSKSNPGGPFTAYDGHLTPNQLQKRANIYLHSLGIRETLHQLRHLFGTAAYKATGRDLRATQELMRHRSPVSTAGYTAIDMGESARALDLLPVL